MDVLRYRALLRAGRLAELLLERCDRGEDLLRGGRDLVELARREPAVVADRRVANELADLLRVLGRDLADELDEEAADEAAHVLERRERLLLRPVGEAAAPEVVVLVEVPLAALREVLAPACEPVLERGERLVAVDVDALGLGLDLVLERVHVGRALLDVDRGDDRSGEVQDLLELARSDVEEVADAARDALEEPDVRDRSSQVDVTHALTAHLLARHLDAAALADDALVADALVLAAVALPVLGRTEDALAEEAVALGLQGAVVDRLGLRDLARGPVSNLLARGKPDSNRVEIVDVDQGVPTPPLLRLLGQLPQPVLPAPRPLPWPSLPGWARRPSGRRAARPRGARARRPGRPAPALPRPPRPWAGGQPRAASRARGRCRALPRRGAARRPPRA